MLKRLLLGALGLTLLVAGGLYYWAGAVFASEAVRRAVESQLTRSLGQPVHIGSMGATVLPRVTMTLNDVRIGEPARLTAAHLDVGTAFRALISRRIEHASVRLRGARVELPLPALRPASSGSSTDSPASPAVELVSIDEITLDDVEVVSGGRTLRGDLRLAVAGTRVDIVAAEFDADGTPIRVTGRIDDPAGPTGELSIRAPSLDLLRLVAFAGDFSAGSTSASTSGTSASSPDAVPMNLAVSLEIERAQLGTLALDALSGRAAVTDEAVTLTPIHFGALGGQAEGALTLTLADTPEFTLAATVSRVDLAALTAFAGHADLLTGRFTGRLDVKGRGTTADAVIRSVHGTARIDATDGSVKGLGLVRAVVLAGSMRTDSQAQAQAASGSSVERFSRLGATLALAGGTASTRDLRFQSEDLILDASGTFRLDGSNVDLNGRVQLSDALTARAGRDLVRYTAENGRVTLPASISGSAEALSVRIDTGAVLKRAITNRANEEIKKGLGRILGR